MRKREPSIGLDLRPEALALIGEPAPWYARKLPYILLGSMALCLLWSFFAQVDQIIVAPGRLITTEPTVVVQPFENGVIRSIEAAVGMEVEQGQPLLVLDSTVASSSTQDLLYREKALKAEIRRLEIESGGAEPFEQGEHESTEAQHKLLSIRRAEFSSRNADFSASIRKFERKMTASKSIQRLLALRLEIAQEVESNRDQLMLKGAGTRAAMLQARTERLVLEEQIANGKAEEEDCARQIDKLKAEQNSFTEGWRREIIQRLIDARRELESVRQQLSVARKRSELVVLRAPTSGVVLEMGKRSVGSVVQVAETLVTLVPKGAKLEAQAEISGKDIGLVRADHFAQLKFNSLPYQQHGTLAGSVRTIGNDVLPSDDPASAGRIYRARLRLGPLTFRNVPREFHLMPGMELNAEIKVGERTIISYLFHPLTKLLDESFREPAGVNAVGSRM